MTTMVVPATCLMPDCNGPPCRPVRAHHRSLIIMRYSVYIPCKRARAANIEPSKDAIMHIASAIIPAGRGSKPILPGTRWKNYCTR